MGNEVTFIVTAMVLLSGAKLEPEVTIEPVYVLPAVLLGVGVM
jgi:hypothetical protein